MEELKNYFETLNIEYTEDGNRLIETLIETLSNPNIDEDIIKIILVAALNKKIISSEQFTKYFEEAARIKDQQLAQEVQANVADATPVQEAQANAADATPAQEAQADAADATPAQEAQANVADATPAQEAQANAADATPVQEAQTNAADATPVQEAQVNAADATPAQEAQADATPAQEAQADEKRDKTNKSVCRNKTFGSTLLKSLPGAVIVGGILLGTISVAPITIPYAYALGKLTIIGGTLAGGFVSCKICNRLSKIKLQKNNCECKISKITTDESKEIELEAEKTMTEIRKMLVNPSKDNYRLQISVIKYKNQCELLEKRIDMKKNQKVAKGDKILQSLSILALNSIRKNMQKNLDEANLLLEKAEEKRKDPSRLNKLNTKLQEINENISNIRQASISDNTGHLSSEEKSKNVSSYLKLSIKSSGLEFIRNAKIRNIRLTQSVYNFFNIKIRRTFKALASKFDNARHR